MLSREDESKPVPPPTCGKTAARRWAGATNNPPSSALRYIFIYLQPLNELLQISRVCEQGATFCLTQMEQVDSTVLLYCLLLASQDMAHPRCPPEGRLHTCYLIPWNYLYHGVGSLNTIMRSSALYIELHTFYNLCMLNFFCSVHSQPCLPGVH